MESIILRNGVEIPQIGIGTWQITDRLIMNNIVSKAYDAGYRLIDTAAAYSNEISIAKALGVNGISRNDVVISDKAWNTSRGFVSVQEACKNSMKKLKTDYLDLYLIHWPASKKLYSNWAEINAETWRGVEQLYYDGYVRAIGVCNFKIHHLQELKKTANIMPFINQIECHPGMNQKQIIEYCKLNDIQVEASSPLGNGDILSNDVLKRIAQEKNKTIAQIALRWGIQKGLIVIPKTSNEERLYQNIDIYNFELNDKEMEIVNEIPYCGGIGIDSDEVTQFG